MSMKVMRRLTGNTRFQGYKLLMLYTLANNADDDGLYWPISWNIEDVRDKKDGIHTILRALENAGEIVLLEPKCATRLWVTIAFTPREMKEIAMRCLQMSHDEAVALVSKIVARQLH